MFSILAAATFLAGFVLQSTKQFTVASQTKSSFTIGERLTYNISFNKLENVAYAEIYTVSKGKLQDKDAIELSAKIKSSGLLSAVFYLFDDTRTTFVSEQTGLPFYVRTVSTAGVLPKEKISNFLKSPTTNYDLLSMIYKVRESGGAGSFSVEEDKQVYSFDFAATGGEVINTDAGEFETTVSTVQSSYLTEIGITDLRVNFTIDDRRIPVAIRFKTEKGTFDAKIASIQMLEPKTTPENSPKPTKTPTPKPTKTPIPTPAQYIENKSLSGELPFVLGETLEYSVTKGSQNVGNVILRAKERKEFNGDDSVLLTANISNVGQGNSIFGLRDGMEAQVDPYTLTPRQVSIRMNKSLSVFNQVARFDQNLGTVSFGNAKQVDVPIGTHSILSLAYAIRSFNLKPSLDPKNPVNDTRVALFLGSKAYVLTLRPSNSSIIDVNGKKVLAQLVSIRTGNRSIDRLNIRLWLSNDRKRKPLRFVVGSYQADLISSKTELPK